MTTENVQSSHSHSSQYPSRERIEVSAGLVFHDAHVLITQRHLGGHLGGLWEFPGGKRNPAESFEDCLRRELSEELGIEVEVGELIETITHEYPEKAVMLKFFVCRWVRHEPRALGCRAFAWVEAHQLAGYAFPPADAPLVRKLQTSPHLWKG